MELGHLPHRNALAACSPTRTGPRICLALGLVLATACVPVPSQREKTIGRDVSASANAVVRLGETTRQQLLAALGPPSFEWPDEHVLGYRWRREDARWKYINVLAVAINIDNVARPFSTADLVLDVLYPLPTVGDLSSHGTDYLLMVALDGDGRVEVAQVLSSGDTQAMPAIEQWVQAELDRRLARLLVGKASRADVHRELGAPTHVVNREHVELYEWAHLGATLIIRLGADGRVAEKLTVPVAGSDWEATRFDARVRAVISGQSLRGDVHKLFGEPARHRIDRMAEIFLARRLRRVLLVRYGPGDLVASVSSGESLPTDEAYATEWQVAQSAMEIGVFLRVKPRVDDQFVAPFGSAAGDERRTDKIQLFLDDSMPIDARSGVDLLAASCLRDYHEQGWVFVVLQPGLYFLRAATFALRDPSAGIGMPPAPIWEFVVPSGPDAVYVGTLLIDAKEGKPKDGKPSFLYNLKMMANSTDAEAARLVASSCGKSLVNDGAALLRPHGPR